MDVIITISGYLLASLLGYLLFLSERRNKGLLSYCESYIQLLGSTFLRVKDVHTRLEQIDRIGAFKADDDTGFVFTEMLSLVGDLELFLTRYVNVEGSEESEQGDQTNGEQTTEKA